MHRLSMDLFIYILCYYDSVPPPFRSVFWILHLIIDMADVLLVAIWPKTHTTENLRRDGRLTLLLVFNGALLEMRARATLKAEHQTKLDLAVFQIKIESVIEHRSNYADVTTGVTFKLHDPERTFARWREQIVALKQLT
jgi:hypothetical protein